MKFSFLMLGACLLTAAVAAQTSVQQGQTDNAAERSRIVAQRNLLEAGFKAEEAACYSRFMVNACLEEIRPRRAQAMADLRRQELVLGDFDRKARAADQIQKTEEKNSPERQQQRADQEAQARQATDRRAERNEERTQTQVKATADAQANVSAAQARQKSSQAKAGEAQSRHEQAVANTLEAKTRADKAAQRQAEREKKRKEKGPPTGKPLPALP
jgi:colicin import membrane protein